MFGRVNELDNYNDEGFSGSNIFSLFQNIPPSLVMLVGTLVVIGFELYAIQLLGDISDLVNQDNKILNDVADYPENKELSISMQKEIFVDVSGAVVNPGVYSLPLSSHIKDAIHSAGGFSSEASAEYVSKFINLASLLKDSQKIYIPFSYELSDSFLEDTFNKQKQALLFLEGPVVGQGLQSMVEGSSLNDETLNTSLQAEQTNISSSDASSETNDTAGVEKININNASSNDLESLPGIGESYAQRIITNRPYVDVAELRSKTKIPNSTIAKLVDLIIF